MAGKERYVGYLKTEFLSWLGLKSPEPVSVAPVRVTRKDRKSGRFTASKTRSASPLSEFLTFYGIEE